MVEIYLNQPVTMNYHSIPMTIQSIKVLLLSKMIINLIVLILILLVNVLNFLNSLTREGVFQVIMNQEDADNHLNRFLEVQPTKLVLVHNQGHSTQHYQQRSSSHQVTYSPTFPEFD